MKLCPECYSEFQDDFNECPQDSSVLTELEPDPLIGTQVAGRYVVESIVGRGGMGVVYKARHAMMDRLVAIKMLHSHLVSDNEAMKRFHREAKAVSRVQHPHTITLYDFGITPGGQPFIVMDFIEGTSLKGLIATKGALPLAQVGHIFSQVVDALACAHKEGVIHRDLKPENIMLTKRGEEKEWVEVVDFGISMLLATEQSPRISRITRIGDVCGSPPYMSPEQCISSLQIDIRSDIYSLGVCLYEALTARLPFRSKSAVEMIDCHLYAPPTPLRVANSDLALCDRLSTMLTKALQKEPEKRQKHMEEFGQELSEAIKLDSLRLKSFRKPQEVSDLESLLSEAQETASLPELSGEHKAPQAMASNGEPFWQTLVALPDMIFQFLFPSGAKGKPERDYLLSECPFCGVAVEPQLNFCLSCGRTLASPKDVSKLRPAQRIFAFPKFQKVNSVSHPHFSRRARLAGGNTGSILGMPPFVVAIIFGMALYLILQTPEGKIWLDGASKFTATLLKMIHAALS